MEYKPGTRVVVVGDVPPVLTALTGGLRAGQIGTVVTDCSCLRSNEMAEIFTQKFIGRMSSNDMHRVAFEFGKTCVPAEHLRKIDEDTDDDKMVDWKDVPKPWDIGVTDDPRKKKVH
jgi:hypothetical protein